MELKDRARHAAKQAFGEDWQADGWAVAPGRIELIGNHIDYNGGPVLAGAIDRVLVIGTGPLESLREIAMVAADVSDTPVAFDPLKLGDWHASDRDHGPVVYIKGVVAALSARGIPFRTGVSLAIAGDIPRGFGVSSSAALCVATILALTIDTIAPLEMVAIAREAEHRAGSPVGAMDQSASVAGDVILFHGQGNAFERMTPDLGEHVFALASSGVDRSLRVSRYGERVRESAAALHIINETFGFNLPNLAAFSPFWEEHEVILPSRLDATLFRRLRHVVTETRRVQDAVVALTTGDLDRFGLLMNASGISSARDYDISHPEVETLVQLLRNTDVVLGARMMGGGEGGPALALIRTDAVDKVAEKLARDFYATRSISGPSFQVCTFGPGAHREDA